MLLFNNDVINDVKMRAAFENESPNLPLSSHSFQPLCLTPLFQCKVGIENQMAALAWSRKLRSRHELGSKWKWSPLPQGKRSWLCKLKPFMEAVRLALGSKDVNNVGCRSPNTFLAPSIISLLFFFALLFSLWGLSASSCYIAHRDNEIEWPSPETRPFWEESIARLSFKN